MIEVTMSAPYSRAPDRYDQGIPIFSEEDRYSRNYDRIARDHLRSLDAGGQNPFIEESTWTSIEESTKALVESVAKPGQHILDAGVGLGRLLRQFPRLRRFGVDISLDYLIRAKKHGIDVAQARLESMPYETESFDIVISTDVLEHVLDFYTVSLELARVLKPSGHLVIRTPFNEDMKTYYDYRDYDLTHLRRFDLWDLRLHFERVLGLKYVTHKMVLPLYRGASTAKVRPLDCGERLSAILDKLPPEIVGLEQFKAHTLLSTAMFEHLMNSVATNHAGIFEEIVQLIANPVEINIVFQKPSLSPGT